MNYLVSCDYFSDKVSTGIGLELLVGMKILILLILIISSLTLALHGVHKCPRYGYIFLLPKACLKVTAFKSYKS